MRRSIARHAFLFNTQKMRDGPRAVRRGAVAAVGIDRPMRVLHGRPGQAKRGQQVDMHSRDYRGRLRCFFLKTV